MTCRPPILEFDPTRPAVLEPSEIVKPSDVPERCVLCFFQEVIAKLSREGRARVIARHRSELAVQHLYELDCQGARLALAHPGVGAPLSAAMLEEVIARGCRKFIVCGGAGALEAGHAVGRILVPASAVRDEGTSYHYLPPAREVAAGPRALAAIERVLAANGIEYLVTKAWTTDAPYRETRAKVERRRAEGCLAVEMEAAALFAVAKFRGVELAEILYAGDDLSGEKWESRGWHGRKDIRETLFRLAAEACLGIE
jgi:uridine phosphorylase